MLCVICGKENEFVHMCSECLVNYKKESFLVNSFEYYLNNIFPPSLMDDFDPKICYKIWVNKLNNKLKNKRFYFMTLAHRKNSKNKFKIPEDVNIYGKFIKHMVCEGGFEKLGFPLDSAIGWAESGKDADNSKLHSHFILDFKNNNNPNLAREVKRFFNEVFPNNKIIEKDEYDNKSFTEIYLEDKLYYVLNEYKDSHSNYIDLGIRYGFGHLWEALSKLKN